MSKLLFALVAALAACEAAAEWQSPRSSYDMHAASLKLRRRTRLGKRQNGPSAPARKLNSGYNLVQTSFSVCPPITGTYLNLSQINDVQETSSEYGYLVCQYHVSDPNAASDCIYDPEGNLMTSLSGIATADFCQGTSSTPVIAPFYSFTECPQYNDNTTQQSLDNSNSGQTFLQVANSSVANEIDFLSCSYLGATEICTYNITDGTLMFANTDTVCAATSYASQDTSLWLSQIS